MTPTTPRPSKEAVDAAMDYAHSFPITKEQWAILEPEPSSCPDASCIQILAAEVEWLRFEKEEKL